MLGAVAAAAAGGDRPVWEADMIARLELGCLTECPGCHRKKLEPGAARCPDCTAVRYLYSRFPDILEAMYDHWGTPALRSVHVPKRMRDDATFKTFGDLEELMRAYWHWKK